MGGGRRFGGALAADRPWGDQRAGQPAPSSSGTQATRITNTFHQRAGAAMVAATGTSHARSVRAPKARTTTATTSRIGRGIWIAAGGTSRRGAGLDCHRLAELGPPLRVEGERDGRDRGRGAKRDRQGPPLAPEREPQDTDARRDLVVITTAHAAGQRNPTTIARAISRLTLPRYSSARVGGKSSTNGAQRPPRTRAIAYSIPIHRPATSGNGSRWRTTKTAPAAAGSGTCRG